MKILITGKTGYIARSFANYLQNAHKSTNYDLLDLRDNSWQTSSFTGYDAVLHTAGLAHIRENRHNQYDYYNINRDLAFDVAKKAKADGVRQFIFLSSISVYGLKTGLITKDTLPAPNTHYGRSKLAAESLITPLADDTFKVAILRFPMVYGPGCPGNYSKLCKLVEIAPFFPNYPNARSMISIENLCTGIFDIIKDGQGGLHFPRDPSHISTAEMATNIAKSKGKNLPLTKIFNPLISLLMPINTISKLFGTLIIKI